VETHPARAHRRLVPFHDRLPHYGAAARTGTDKLQE
jgi:hypothetical protein